MAFFIMIFDSLRQSRAVVRNSFGVSRFNTRLNFYIFRNAKFEFTRRKTLALFRFVKPRALKLKNRNFQNFESLELTQLSYSFSTK